MQKQCHKASEYQKLININKWDIETNFCAIFSQSVMFYNSGGIAWEAYVQTGS